MEKDYYKILGVPKSASADEIKKAFRKLAHAHHPDKQGGNSEKFKEASEAYSVLGNSKKRAEYDAYGRVFTGNQSGGSGGFNWNESGNQQYGFDFSEIFNEFGDIFGGFGGRSQEQTRRGRDISIDLEIPFKESVFGTVREVLLTKTARCETCKGDGGKPGTKTETCSSCNGKGKVHETKHSILGTLTTVRACETCHGSGSIPEVICVTCHGEGLVRKEHEIRIAVPSGVDNGEMIRLTNAGEAVRDGVPGDLYVKLHIRPDQRFSKEGANIRMKLPLKLSDALLGSEQKIETLDGDITLKIPAGVSHGETLRVRGKGVPQNGGKRGDLLISVAITLPKRLSRDAKKLIEKLREEGI